MGELHTLCGFLNFLNKAVFPGRTFTRRMYSKFSGIMDIKMIPDRENRVMEEDRMLTSSSFKLKKHHHVRLDAEFKLDCEVWLSFLTDKNIYNAVSRNMVDLLPKLDGNIEPSIQFTSDASALPQLGYGCMFDNKWMYGKWDEKFITDQEPSIEYLELFALTAGVLTWSNYMTDCTMTVHCDNVAVVHMINKLTSSCKNCMFLLRLLVLNGMIKNRKLRAHYISTKDNFLSDTLSCLKIKKSKRLTPKYIKECPDTITTELWPMSKIWMKS